jgi:hypothetical protein
MPDHGDKAMMKFVKILLGLAVLLIFVAIIAGSNTPSGPVSANQVSTTTTTTTDTAAAQPVAPPPTFPVPTDEQNFVNLVASFTQQYNSAGNDMEKGAVRHARQLAICQQFSRRVAGWVGTITTLDATDKGNGILTLKLSDTISAGTTNNEFSEDLETTPTLIPSGSPLFNKVSGMKVGDTVTFSGTFGASDTDCFQEDSLTTDGSMQNPDFLIHFSDVSEATVSE